MTGEHIRSFQRETKPLVLEFEIKGLPKILSNSSRNGWRGIWAEKRKWKTLVKDMVILSGFKHEPLTKAKLTLVRHSSQQSDFDGLVSSFKSLIDGLKEAGVIVDDKPSVIGQPSYSWAKAKMREGKVTIKVEEVI